METSFERTTTLFEGQAHVCVNDMHIVLDSDIKEDVTADDLRQIGLTLEDYGPANWFQIKGIPSLMYAILWHKTDYEFRHGLYCLLERDGTVRAFFDHRDLKAFVIECVLMKHVLYIQDWLRKWSAGLTAGASFFFLAYHLVDNLGEPKVIIYGGQFTDTPPKCKYALYQIARSHIFVGSQQGEPK